MEGERPWVVDWEDGDKGFLRSLARMNLPWEMFDRLARHGVDFLLQTDPYETAAEYETAATHELPGTGHRFLETRYRFPDLPAMLIAYEVDDANHRVTVKGAEPVWESDLFDPDAF